MTNQYTVAARTIKDTVSALDVGNALGLEIRSGRCRCPIHGGNDFNCVLYPGNRGFYCHVCKAGGDVVQLIQQYNGSTFKEAVAWFNDTFHLGFTLDAPMDPDAARKAEFAQKKRKKEIEYRKCLEDFRFDMALKADRIVQTLEEQRDKNVPVTPDEDWNPAFCEAVRLLPDARRYAQDCLFDCFETKK